MAVSPSHLRHLPEDGTPVFSPYATDVPPLAGVDYVQEEWVASGAADGPPYATTVLVRRPRDAARFSGVVIAEPLHVHGIAPIWIYTAPSIVRSGHAWVEVTAQKTTLDLHDRHVHVVERFVREARGEVPVVDGSAVGPSLPGVRVLDVVADHAAGLGAVSYTHLTLPTN